MPNGNGTSYGNGKAHFIGTWAWRLMVAILLAVLGFNFKAIHGEVYTGLPSRIEHVDETKVSQKRFDDFCVRLGRIEDKLDRLIESK